MNQGERQHIENSFATKLNRVRKLSKYAKEQVKKLLFEDLSGQEDEIAESKFITMVEEMELHLKELKENWKKIK